MRPRASRVLRPILLVLFVAGLLLFFTGGGTAEENSKHDLIRLPSEDGAETLEGLFPSPDGSHVSEGFFVGRLEDLTPEQKQALEKNNQGVRLLSKGKIDEAIENFREGMRLMPGYVTCLRNLGIAYKTKGDFQRARTAFSKVLSLSPDDAEAHVGLGLVLFELGERKASKTELTRASELRPSLRADIETFLKERIGK